MKRLKNIVKGKLRRWLGIEESDKRIQSCEDKIEKLIEYSEMLGKEFSAYLIDKVKREMF